MPDTWQPYDRDAAAFATRYDAVDPEAIHRAWSHLLPPDGGTALDVGAGSGRDARWLAARGLDVVAVEPAHRMRERARTTHGDAPVTWLDDRLPALAATRAAGRRFDVILLNAVWIHVPTDDRAAAMRALAALLAPGGLLVMTLRHGPPDPARRMWPCDDEELDRYARAEGLAPVGLDAAAAPDFLGRPEVSWTVHAFRAAGTATARSAPASTSP